MSPTGGEPDAGLTQGCKPFPKKTELKFGEVSLMWCPKTGECGPGFCPGGKCGDDKNPCKYFVKDLGVPSRCKVICNNKEKAFSRVFAPAVCRCKRKRA